MDQPARGLLHCGDVSLDVMRMVYGRHNRRERRHHGANSRSGCIVVLDLDHPKSLHQYRDKCNRLNSFTFSLLQDGDSTRQQSQSCQMDQSATPNRPSAADMALALDCVLVSDVLGAKSRLRGLLSYLVQQEINGRGDRLKAYTIGVDAFGRPDDFDPNSDSIVRVEINRLRSALARYYAGPGVDDPFRIDLPRGQYRPVLKPANVHTEGPKRPAEWSVRRILIASAVLLFAFGFVAWMAFDSRKAGVPSQDQPPLLEVGKVEALVADGEVQAAAVTVRKLLVGELAQFQTLRVLQLDDRADSRSHSNRPAVEFRVVGFIAKPGAVLILHLTMIRVSTSEVVWSERRVISDAGGKLDPGYLAEVRSLIGNLAGPNGVMVASALRDMKGQHSHVLTQSDSAYECLLRWYAFDTAKDPKEGSIARACLSRLTEAQTQSGAIWSAYGFMLFLDWSRAGQPSDSADFSAALSAIERGTQLEPGNAIGHEYLASVLMAAGQFEGARRHYLRAIQLSPSKPDLEVLLGWSSVLQGDWDVGIEAIKRGIRRSPAPPGWFRIPVSMDAFRRGVYREALIEAEAIIRAGDDRGLPLALAAAVALGDLTRIVRYDKTLSDQGKTAIEALSAIRSVVNVPELLDRYQETLAWADAR